MEKFDEEVAGRWSTRRLGPLVPGLVTGAGDVDPSFVITATVVGAAFQYSLLWLVLLCIPILLAVFNVSARIGQQTQQGMVELLRHNYGRVVATLCALLVVAINLAMIIADSMAVSEGMGIILGERRYVFIVLVCFAVWYALIFRNYRKMIRVMIWAALPLFAYVVSAIVVGPDYGALAKSVFLPRIMASPDYAAGILAVFGSLLTPYLLVWQTTSRREMIAPPATAILADAGPAALGPMVEHRAHQFGGLLTIMLSFCIMVAAAVTLHLSGGDLTMAEAAGALAPAVSGFAPLLFAIAIIGAGFVALPILVASMCYSVAEAFGWNYGLSEHPWEAKRFYVLISVSMLIAVGANLVNVNPVKVLYDSQVLAGVLTVPVLIFILLLSNDRRVMRTTNSRWQNFWIGAASGGLLATLGILLVMR
ncbi:MAG: divalent metal cation transporter [Acidobacteriaceae bacterium]